MLHGYKIIAICTTKMHSQQDMSFLTELNERLRYLGYRIFIYSTCSDLYWNSRSEQGEKSVFDLIDFDVLDAVIITYEKIKNRTISRNIARSAMEKGLPVIVLDGHIDGCINMNFDFRAGFEKIVRHVVEDHGLRRLHMMAGMKDNVFSDERIEVFRKVLAEHDIPVDDSMISYGDFWSTPTRAATEALIARGELPEAVVCANDSMAVTMCGVLRDHGISVPDDIIITGFDGIEDVQVSSPTLSTCVCASSVTADMIADIILGQRPMAEGGEDISLVPKLGRAQSCGCGEVEQINVSEHLTRINDNFNRYQSEELHFFEMTSNIFGCKNFEEAALRSGFEKDEFEVAALVDDMDTMIRSVEAGLGVAIISEKVASSLSGRVKVADIKDFNEDRVFYMINLKSTSFSPAAEAFSAYVKAQMKDK